METKKGILLAGGTGSRLYPSSLVVSKQLINVFDKPLIYYPLSTLMLAGINDILLITNSEYIDQFKILLGDGSHLGISISYKIQSEPKGIAEALLISEDFIDNQNVCLILGDNIIYGNSLIDILREAVLSQDTSSGATIFSYPVKDPQRFGVIEYQDDKVISIEEKPLQPKSNRALIGLYFFNHKAVEYTKIIEPSARGELEIVDVCKHYLNNLSLNVKHLNRGITWIDAGTFDSLLLASNIISNIEKMQIYKISCPEEIAYRNGWISKEDITLLSSKLENSGYGKYLKSIIYGPI